MTTALAERPAAAALSADEVDLIRRTVANGATDAELKLFLFDCQRRGVHPLDKLLHFTKRAGRYTPVTSIDFMRSQAAMSGEMAGSDDPVFQDYDVSDGHPDEAMVTVYRMTQGQRFPYSATARWSEYYPENAPMWRKMPHTMLGKCAEALALRKAFPRELAGLYAREEMDQAGEPQNGGYTVTSPAPLAPTMSSAEGERENAAGAPAGESAQPSDGQLYVSRVDMSHTKNKNIQRYLVTFSDGRQASTIKEKLGTLATECCQFKRPIDLRPEDLEETRFGLNLIALHTVHAEEPALPIADDDMVV